MPPRHPDIARALGPVRTAVDAALAARPGAVHVACSGGADSVALAGLLALLAGSARAGRRFGLSLGHVDHGLRSASDGEREAALVREVGARLEVPVSVTRLSLDPGPAMPHRARVARYTALRDQASEHAANWLALGHTGTDQVETVLMHLARGAGLDGLAGMRTLEGDLLRPLLHFDRATIRQLCGHLDLPFLDDPTNDDARHPRVAIRRDVLPVLRRLNPRLEAAVAGASRRLAQAEEALDLWTRRELEGRRATLDGRPGLDIGGWHDLPAAVGTRLVRSLCDEAGVDASELRGEVVADIDAAARVQARHRACGTPAEGVAPRRWDLRPKIVVFVDKSGLRADRGPSSNH